MINAVTVVRLKNWFADYVKSYASNAPAVQQNMTLKEEHTRRVCGEILHLGHQLGLAAGELRLAEISALFHDIGRFEQYARYATFVDAKSVNHAQLGVAILQETGVLDDLEDADRDLLLRVIGYHNRAFLPSDEDATCLFFSRLLRDADKLDIWRVVTDYYRRDEPRSNSAIELGLPDLPALSAAVVEDLLNARIVDIKHLKSLNDFKLLQVGWVYDLNFVPAFERLQAKGYLQMLRAALPQSETVDEIFSAVSLFMTSACAPDSGCRDRVLAPG